MTPRFSPALGINPQRDHYLWMAIGFSLLLHVVLMLLHFTFPDASRAIQNRALDIILVNSKSEHAPKKAQALAQANMDGGGDVKEDLRAQSPLPESHIEQRGTEQETKKQNKETAELRTQRMTSSKRSRESAAPVPVQESPPEVSPEISGQDLANSAREMMRLRAEIAKNTQTYNQMPRVKNLGTRTEEYRFARYTDDWRYKIEKVGTLNYPSAARGKIYGSLMLSVRIRRDGSVERVEIDRPSGKKVLDDAARRIVQLASPFAAFPEDIRRDTDIIEITRVWHFTDDRQLKTKSR